MASSILPDEDWSELKLPFSQFRKRPSNESRTPLIYYGGKSRDADWIISHFAPHTCFVDVFGGGGAVTFRKYPSKVDVYNDIGNVSTFMRVLRDHGDELYRKLYFTPFSREEFQACVQTWESDMEKGDLIEWARKWFVVINQGYTHEECSDTWHVAKQVNSAAAFAAHVDDLPAIVDRLRTIQIEHLSFEKLIPMYDLEDGSTLFYADPPYLHETRADVGNYKNEMTVDQHVELLVMLRKVNGQVVVSGYDSKLYNDYLRDWHVVRKTAKSAIQNSKSLANRGERTEVLWIKEHRRGLWHQEGSFWP